MSKYWMVHREDGNPPTIKHLTREDADKEAKRLSLKNSGKVFNVLEIVGSITQEKPKRIAIFLAFDTSFLYKTLGVSETYTETEKDFNRQVRPGEVRVEIPYPWTKNHQHIVDMYFPKERTRDVIEVIDPNIQKKPKMKGKIFVGLNCDGSVYDARTFNFHSQTITLDLKEVDLALRLKALLEEGFTIQRKDGYTIGIYKGLTLESAIDGVENANRRFNSPSEWSNYVVKNKDFAI